MTHITGYRQDLLFELMLPSKQKSATPVTILCSMLTRSCFRSESCMPPQVRTKRAVQLTHLFVERHEASTGFLAHHKVGDSRSCWECLSFRHNITADSKRGSHPSHVTHLIDLIVPRSLASSVWFSAAVDSRPVRRTLTVTIRRAAKTSKAPTLVSCCFAQQIKPPRLRRQLSCHTCFQVHSTSMHTAFYSKLPNRQFSGQNGVSTKRGSDNRRITPRRKIAQPCILDFTARLSKASFLCHSTVFSCRSSATSFWWAKKASTCGRAPGTAKGGRGFVAVRPSRKKPPAAPRKQQQRPLQARMWIVVV